MSHRRASTDASGDGASEPSPTAARRRFSRRHAIAVGIVALAGVVITPIAFHHSPSPRTGTDPSTTTTPSGPAADGQSALNPAGTTAQTTDGAPVAPSTSTSAPKKTTPTTGVHTTVAGPTTTTTGPKLAPPPPISADGVSLSQGAIRPGGSLRLQATGFRSKSPVRIELHSDPILLATPSAASDGSVSADLTIPTSAPEGDHHVVASGEDPNGAPLVRSIGLVLDLTAPGVLSVDASPATVSPGGTVTFSMHLTDASGVDYVTFQPMLDGATTFTSWCEGPGQLTSGTAQDGVWSATCTIPTVVNAGTYRVWPFGRDILGNYFNTNGGPTTNLRGVFTVQ